MDDDPLKRLLPRYTAPDALKRRLAATWPVAPRRVSAWRGRLAAGTAALALSAAAVLCTTTVVQRGAASRALETEIVNDHVRVLQGAPLAQVTGGVHEVVPWFGGKLDFAPTLRFAGSEAFPLQGGAVEPFLDRRAAVFVYRRRFHTASLFVVRSDGLPFSGAVQTRTVRGFTVSLWKNHDQGYALISDLNPTELAQLQAQIASP